MHDHGVRFATLCFIYDEAATPTPNRKTARFYTDKEGITVKTSEPTSELSRTLDLLVDLLLLYLTYSRNGQNQAETNSAPAQAND